jgi:hypothetical protein
MRFAHLKTHHRFERLRLRGLSGARDEFHLAAIVQNLKTLAKHLADTVTWTSRRYRVRARASTGTIQSSLRQRSKNQARIGTKQRPQSRDEPLAGDFINGIGHEPKSQPGGVMSALPPERGHQLWANRLQKSAAPLNYALGDLIER